MKYLKEIDFNRDQPLHRLIFNDFAVLWQNHKNFYQENLSYVFFSPQK